MVHPGAGPALA